MKQYTRMTLTDIPVCTRQNHHQPTMPSSLQNDMHAFLQLLRQKVEAEEAALTGDDQEVSE